MRLTRIAIVKYNNDLATIYYNDDTCRLEVRSMTDKILTSLNMISPLIESEEEARQFACRIYRAPKFAYKEIN